MRRSLVGVLLLGLVLAACSAEETVESTTTTEPPAATTTTATPLPPLEMTSRSFEEGQTIPARFTCEGPDVNPPLEIVGLPVGTVSLVMILNDPDAPVGVWDHWVEYDIDAGPGDYSIPAASSQIGIEGLNSWNLPGYGGPCPPEGQEHRYFFTVYALNARLDLPAELDSDGVRTVMEGKVVAEVQLMGRFAR